MVFVDENGNTIKEETQTVDEDGDGMFKFSELTLPDGYELNGGGDQFTGEESYEVPVTETLKAAYVTITFETKDGEVIEKVIGYAADNGLYPKGLTFSPVTGAKGNIEYLMYLTREHQTLTKETIHNVVESSHAELDR